MIKKTLLLLISACALAACTDAPAEKYTDYVDTSIGTGGHGHVFVGANVPFGFVQLGPTSIPQKWDWCSGYHESDSTVIGFSHTHLSGTGIGDLFDVTVMPVVGEVNYARGEENDPASGMWSYADRTKEISRPGYYSVPLLRYGIRAELTATTHVGLHKYTFPESGDAAIVFDLENGGCWDKPTGTFMEEVQTESPETSAIRGYRYSKGWADNQKIYFYAEFSRPYDSFSLQGKDNMYGRVAFSTKKDESILVKVGLSAVSMEGAKANMDSELPGWNFEETVAAADRAWNAELSKIHIETADKEAKKIFYTAFYHTMIAPSVFCDVDGAYRGADGEVHQNDGFTNYTTFSLWDTYRAAMPLMTIVHPEKVNDMVNTMLHIYQQQGKLPVWHLMGCETDCMVGNPGIPPVADALLKGYDGFDKELAIEAMTASALRPDRGQDLRMKYGYIPSDMFNESVAYDMEYSIADWALAQAAKKLAGDTQDEAKAAEYMKVYEHFDARSHSYRHFFDSETGFMRGKKADGRFRTPFSPFASTHREDDYCEGNGWQYTWLAPHDFKGLVGCFGSKEAFLTKLDALFTAQSDLEGENASPDISGLIGQYAHGNEPSHHILYFYTMAGQPWKTADKVREVLSTLYHAEPDGLSGNEDVGQMSAWYILSSLGFYQVEPAGGRYFFGSPLFDKAEIKVAGGTFVVRTIGNSTGNRYIQSIKLNGEPYTKPFIDFKDINAGGTLTIVMGAEPKVWYCADEPDEYKDQRPAPEARLFCSDAVDEEIARVCGMLENPRLAWMFANCFPNTLDTTVHYGEDENGQPETYVYTGDIPAMWLRDSGAQVWPYIQLMDKDPKLQKMIAGTINRQFKCICIDPYANAFNVEPVGAANKTDLPEADPYVFERKWEIDSHCYPIRLAYEYWKKSGDASVFGKTWREAIRKTVDTFKEQQRKDGHGPYTFLRITDRQLDTKCVVGQGNPVKPVGLIASAFRPSDDATTFEFLIPSNFMAVSSLRKAAEILNKVNNDKALAAECSELADEVEAALKKYAVYNHPEYGPIYAFEVDGFGNQFIMDDANVPSLLAMAYLGDVPADDPIYQNTRRFVWSEANPYFYRGAAGEGIGGPHIGIEMIWPMSIMMKAFTSDDDEEIRDCIVRLMTTDAGTGFIHESFHKDNAAKFTRPWFAWQNTLFGELILKIINDGRIDVLNSIN